MNGVDDLRLYATGVPHGLYDELRGTHPVFRSDGAIPFHAVLGYSESLEVLRDPLLYSSARRGILIEDVSPEMVPIMRAMLPFMDPPEHTALRRQILPPLKSDGIARLRADIETSCHAVIDRALGHRDIEFVHEVAAEVPLLAFGALMGLAPAEIEPLRSPSDAIIEKGINHSGEEVARLFDILDALIDSRRVQPRDDFLGLLAQVDDAHRPISRLERNGMLLQIVIGGLETARSAIAGMAMALIEHPAQWERMRSEPGIVPNSVEESLRFVSPVNYLRRTTMRAVRLGGTEIPADARVVVFLGAANRDPTYFADPHRLDVARSNARQHLALGAGHHFCLGAGLARLQLNTFWSIFCRRVRQFHLAGDIVFGGVVQQNFLKALPLHLEVA